jgi:single-strand DNA-binding protein
MKIVSNQVVLTGNLGRTPELTQIQNGNYMCTFSLATHEFFTNADGEKDKRAVWHNIVAWGKNAEQFASTYEKGDFVTIKGMLKYRTYTDKDGVQRKVAQIVAFEVEPAMRAVEAAAA